MTTLALAPAQAGLDNPYWDEVKDQVGPSDIPWDRGLSIGGIGDWSPMRRRFDLTSNYAWTVTDPATVAFVAKHIGRHAFDPLAGTGYWAHILGQLGIEVLCSDRKPPAPGSGNRYHQGDSTWVPVRQSDGIMAALRWGLGRTLLLSWPPYDQIIGEQVLAEYPGDRVVYIGEGMGGCCGNDGMFELLDREWTEIASHRPVQWYGLHDWVTVYERVQRPALTGGAS